MNSDLIARLRWFYESSLDPRIKEAADALETADAEMAQQQTIIDKMQMANISKAERITELEGAATAVIDSWDEKTDATPLHRAINALDAVLYERIAEGENDDG